MPNQHQSQPATLCSWFSSLCSTAPLFAKKLPSVYARPKFNTKVPPPHSKYSVWFRAHIIQTLRYYFSTPTLILSSHLYPNPQSTSSLLSTTRFIIFSYLQHFNITASLILCDVINLTKLQLRLTKIYNCFSLSLWIISLYRAKQTRQNIDCIPACNAVKAETSKYSWCIVTKHSRAAAERQSAN